MNLGSAHSRPPRLGGVWIRPVRHKKQHRRLHYSFIAIFMNNERTGSQGVRSRYEDTRDVSGTLESLVQNESTEHQKHGIPCLVRLTRYVPHLLFVSYL